MITERDLLDEIANIVQSGPQYNSRERGKSFFDPGKLPSKLVSYVKESRGESISAAAKFFEMSPNSLKSIIDGGNISENMLFRLRNTLEYAMQRPGISTQNDEEYIFFGDWRRANSNEVQGAISEVSRRLIFLKKVIEESNALRSAESPIDPIQVAQLIALLEATIAAIKAPLVDVSRTRGFFNWLLTVGRRGAEKGLEGNVSEAINGAVEAGSDLVGKLSDASVVSDLRSIIS